MSIKLMAAAWEMDLPQTEKMVLLCLCDHANDNGECWPSVTRLARKCSVSDRTVQKALKGLRDRSILSWHDAPGRTHKFVIDPRSFFTPEDSSPPKKTARPPKQVHPTPEDSSDEPSVTIKEPSSPCASSDAPEDEFGFEDFEESWGEVVKACGLPPMRAGARDRRRRTFNTRKRQYPDIEDWRRAFATLRQAKWMHGDNRQNWRCDADDFLDPKKFTRLVEGKYGQTD